MNTERMLRRLKEATRMPAPMTGRSAVERLLEETVTAPQDREPVSGPAPQIITQADVDEAVRRLHEEKDEQKA